MNQSSMADGQTTDDIFGNDGAEYSGDHDESVGTTRVVSGSDDPDDIYESTGGGKEGRQRDMSVSAILRRRMESYIDTMYDIPRLQLLSTFFMVAMVATMITYPLAGFYGFESGSEILLYSGPLFGGTALFLNGVVWLRNPQEWVGTTTDRRLLGEDVKVQSETHAWIYGWVTVSVGFFIGFAFAVRLFGQLL
jgi:hypothetical protein